MNYTSNFSRTIDLFRERYIGDIIRMIELSYLETIENESKSVIITLPQTPDQELHI